MNQASACTNQISDLLANLGLFNGAVQHSEGVLKEGNDLLEEEKLVGSSAARQRASCQVGIMSCSAICCYPVDACATGVK